jgi:hypothetical protein
MFERRRQAQNRAASGGDNFSTDRTPEIEQPSTDDVRLASTEKDENTKTAAQTGVVKIAEVVSHAGTVTLVQTDDNKLNLIPNADGMHRFVESNSHHLHTQTLEKLGEFVNPERKVNQVWSDGQVLHKLLGSAFEGGWQWLDAGDLGQFIEAPVLEAPDGRVYYHEKHAHESAGEELLLGHTVSFEGAPGNQIVNHMPQAEEVEEAPEKKAASAKTAEETPVPAQTEPTAPVAAPEAVPSVSAAGGKYKYWTAEALTACIEALSKTSDFANDKAAQEAVAGMSEELRTRPKQIEEQKTAAAMGSGAPAVNEETSKVLEGDKSIPDGRDKVEDHTGIKRPKTDTPSKFATTSQPASANSTGKVIEGDKSVSPTVTGVEDKSGVKKPATTEPSKLASTAPPTNEDTAKVLEGDKSVVPSVTGVEDHTGITLPATTLPEKLAAKTIDPKFIEAAQRAIEDEDDVVFDVAANIGQIFGNVKHMKWFLHAVAEELESMGATEEDGESGLTGDAHTDSFANTGENTPDPQALADHQASAKTATIEHRPGHKNSEGDEAPWCNVKDGKVLDSHATKGEAEKALRAHEYFKGANLKVAADVTTDKAIKLAESAADKLKALYLDSKPITSVNESRPVREAVESIFSAMEMMGEALKVLVKQKHQEEEEAEAAKAVANRKKSSRLGGLHLAAADREEEK